MGVSTHQCLMCLLIGAAFLLNRTSASVQLSSYHNCISEMVMEFWWLGRTMKCGTYSWLRCWQTLLPILCRIQDKVIGAVIDTRLLCRLIQVPWPLVSLWKAVNFWSRMQLGCDLHVKTSIAGKDHDDVKNNSLCVEILLLE